MSDKQDHVQDGEARDHEARTQPGDVRHETARALAERALEHYAEGDKKTGDDLTEQAAAMDRSAVVEVIEELDEDAKPSG